MTIDQFMRKLRRFRGKFTIRPNGWIRAKHMKTNDGHPCCPIEAFVPKKRRDNWLARNHAMEMGCDLPEIIFAADGERGPVRTAMLKALGLKEKP